METLKVYMAHNRPTYSSIWTIVCTSARLLQPAVTTLRRISIAGLTNIYVHGLPPINAAISSSWNQYHIKCFTEATLSVNVKYACIGNGYILRHCSNSLLTGHL